jgi:hypothetical protein
VEARITALLRTVRGDPRCSGALGLLSNTSTAAADLTRFAQRQCTPSVAHTLGINVSVPAWRERLYATGAAAGDAGYVDAEPVRHTRLASLVMRARRRRPAASRSHTPANTPPASPCVWAAPRSMRSSSGTCWSTTLFFKGAPQRTRYFFEAGARNGITESNTYFFEKSLGWTGYLMEPSLLAKFALPFTRPRATIVHGAFCSTPFRANAYDRVPDACGLYGAEVETVESMIECFSWRSLVAAYGVRRLDLWSLDLDNEEEQLRVLSEVQAGPWTK